MSSIISLDEFQGQRTIALDEFLGQRDINLDEFRSSDSVDKFSPIPQFIQAGISQSISGLAWQLATGETAFDLKDYDPSFLEQVGSTLVSFLMPLDIATILLGGGVTGGIARKAGIMAAKKLTAAGVEQGVARSAVRMGVSQAIKSGGQLGAYNTALSSVGQLAQTGQIDVGEVAKSGLKGTALGFAAGAAGGIVSGLGGKPIARTATEIGAFGTAMPALEGRVPSLEDYAMASGVILGMGTISAGSRIISKTIRETAIKQSEVPFPSVVIRKGEPKRIPDKMRAVEGARMDIDPGAVQMLREVAKENETVLRQKYGWKKTDLMSLGVTAKEIKKAAETIGEGQLTAISTAANRAIANAAAAGLEFVRKLDLSNLSKNDRLGFLKQIDKTITDTVTPASRISAEAARVLNAQKKTIRPMLKALEAIKEIDPENAAWLKRAIELYARLDFSNVNEVNRFIRNFTKPEFKDYMYEFWYNSILAGLPTHLVNTISNTFWQAFQTPYMAIRSIVDIPVSKLQGRQREYYLGEIAPLWIGYKSGIKSAIPKALEMIKTGSLEHDVTKWNLEIGRAMESWSRSPSKAMRAVAPVVSMPSRFLRMADVFYRSISYDAKINSLAARAALKEGLSGREFAARMAELVSSPTESMMESARKFSDYTTFMDAPGKITTAIMNLRNQIPGGRFVIPFVRTIGNLLKRGVEMTPGIGLAIQKGQMRGPALSGVISKQIIGTGVSLYFATKYLDGELTGAPPSNKSEREAFYRQGKQAWSVKIGDMWFQYRRVEPFNTVIATVASWGEQWVKNGDAPTSEKIGRMALELGKNLTDVSYLSQLSDLMSAISMGDDSYTSARKLIQRFPSSFIPFSSGFRSLQRAVEYMTTGEVKVHEPLGILESVKSQLPFLSTDVPYRKTVFGEPSVIPGGVLRQWLPYKASKITNDPVEIELERLQLHPGLPAKKIGGIDLTDDQYDRYLTDSGREIYQNLTRIFRSASWQGLGYDPASLEFKSNKIQSVISNIRNKHRALIMGRRNIRSSQ